MAGTINRFSWPEHDSSQTYNRYEMVYVSASGRKLYHVAVKDVPADVEITVDEYNEYWHPIYYANTDVFNIWKPTYSTSANVNPSLNKSQFRNGQLVQKTHGINYATMGLEVFWENVSYTEARSILSFLEFCGGVYSFLMTLPEPYGKTKRFIAKNWNISFNRWNLATIKAIFEETFDIIGASGVPSTGGPQFGSDGSGSSYDSGMVGFWNLIEGDYTSGVASNYDGGPSLNYYNNSGTITYDATENAAKFPDGNTCLGMTLPSEMTDLIATNGAATLNLWMKINHWPVSLSTYSCPFCTADYTHWTYVDGKYYLRVLRSSRIDGITTSIDNDPTNMHMVTIQTGTSDNYRVLINGVERYSTSPHTPSVPRLVLGKHARDFTTGDHWNGWMKCVGLWARYLTDEEITSLYNGGTPLIYSQM